MLALLLACTSFERPAANAPVPAIPSAPLQATAPPTARLETYLEMWTDAHTPRHRSDGAGRLRQIDGPSRVEASEAVALTLALEVGPDGIAEGGAIHFVPSPFWGWSPPQAEAELAPGYTPVEIDVDGVRLEPSARGGQLVWVVRGGSLPAGTEVRWTYGAGPAGAHVDRFTERRAALWVAVDGDGDGVRGLLPEPVVLEVTAGRPAGLHVTWPSVAHPGDEVMVRIAALDRRGNAFRAPTDRGWALSLPPGVWGPARGELDDAGLAEIALQVRGEGVFEVEVSGAGGLQGRSNPMVSRAGATRVRWGDLQIHSALSDGTGEPDDLYRYARRVAGLDVAAVTDHDHWGMRFLDERPELVARGVAATDAAHDPGTFVAVHGYEWTNWVHGHRHVLGFDGPLELRSSLDPATDTPAELWDALRGGDVLTVAHHSAGGPVAVDWSFAPDPVLEPVTEIVSVHGQSEDPAHPGAIYDAVPGNFVVDQLRGGARLGFVGSTDGHDGHPGLAHLAGGQGGLVALVGAEATRASVLDTLRARRTYATNGARLVLRLQVGEAPMGGTLAATAAPVEVAVRVVGTAAIDRVELVRRQGVVGSVRGEGRRMLHHTWTVDGLPDGDFVYVRVVQVDGGLAWSSPVFVGSDGG